MAGKNTLHIDFHTRRVKGNLTVHRFLDNGHFVCYVPTLNLSSYGDNGEEAMDRLMKEVLNDFFENLTSLSVDVANSELKKLGWKRNKTFKRRFASDSYVDKDGVLRNFNLPKETKIDTSLVTV